MSPQLDYIIALVHYFFSFSPFQSSDTNLMLSTNKHQLPIKFQLITQNSLGQVFVKIFAQRDGFVFKVIIYQSLDSHYIIHRFGLPFRLSIFLSPSTHVTWYYYVTRVGQHKDECDTVSANKKATYLTGGAPLKQT